MTEIGQSELRVFLAETEFVQRWPHVTDVLCDSDRAHVGRYRFPADREIACASRVLQRLALSQCAPVAPGAWRFTAEPLTKPALAGPPDAPALEFSVTNTRGLVACAVTRGQQVGVDVEEVKADVPMLVVNRCWSACELEEFAALSDNERPRRFTETWTAKEAYAKARGLGLALDLSLVSVRRTLQTYQFALDSRLDDSSARWSLSLHSPTPSHVLALCVGSGGTPHNVHFEWVSQDMVNWS